MFEPDKNKKASDFSEALILQGQDGEIIFNDLWEGGLNQKPQPRCGCRPFLWALRSSCAWLAPIKKALRNRKAFCWSGWRDSNSRPLAPHTGIFHFVIFRYFYYLIDYQHFTKFIFGFLCIL